MKSEELSYSKNITCPYCNSILVNNENIDDYKLCSHTIFIATDYGFEFVHEDYKDTINIEVKGGNYDNYTANLPIKGIRLVQYTPPPSFFGVYWGFIDN